MRCDGRNFCLINLGTLPAIVLGSSCNVEELVDLERVREARVPVIRRFSGGGTVYVDRGTLFVTWLFGKEAVATAPFPRAIMAWTEALYRPLFGDHPFGLRENDYVLGEYKCGGNAQYIQKDRWLHHTSFLWDFDAEKMGYLHIPKRAPLYRAERAHSEFLCRLKAYFPDRQLFLHALKSHLSKQFILEEVAYEELLPLTLQPHRRTSVVFQP